MHIRLVVIRLMPGHRKMMPRDMTLTMRLLKLVTKETNFRGGDVRVSHFRRELWERFDSHAHHGSSFEQLGGSQIQAATGLQSSHGGASSVSLSDVLGC